VCWLPGTEPAGNITRIYLLLLRVERVVVAQQVGRARRSMCWYLRSGIAGDLDLSGPTLTLLEGLQCQGLDPANSGTVLQVFESLCSREYTQNGQASCPLLITIFLERIASGWVKRKKMV